MCSKLKNGLSKIITKAQVVTKFNVTKSRLNCNYENKNCYQVEFQTMLGDNRNNLN